MKRVLIITYYWPPSGGSGVQRWLKMSKYLPENGWQPVIYTAEDAEYPVEDESLEKDVAPEVEVIRRPIVEPYTFYKKFLGIKKGEKVKAGFINEGAKKSGWKENISLWIRGNFFIPDARCWWIRPSVRYLSKYLKEHTVDAIISTGPPHSMHLIAKALHEKFNIPWVADFRDPWTEIDYYDKLHLTRYADRKHHRLEKEVLTQADKVVTVAPDWARRLENLGAHDAVTIYNGYDSDVNKNETVELPSKFVITYLGVLSAIQNPENLWDAVGELIKEDDDIDKALQINMIGHIDSSVVEMIKAKGLLQNITFTPYVPHSQVAQIHRASTLLLLLLMPDSEPRAKGLLTGKLFEYLASGRTILCIGPEDGDAAHIISECNAGTTVGFDNKAKMKETLKDYYQRFKTSGLPSNVSESIEKYSRKSLAGEYARLLEGILLKK